MEAKPLSSNPWPELRWEDWSATADTLHMWTQIVGKVRLALCPLQEHWWNVTLHVSARGLCTSAMPYGADFLEIEFDFVNHQLLFRTSTGLSAYTPLRAQSVADFYAEFQKTLTDLGVHVTLYGTPVEIQHPIPFAEDTVHAAYDPDAAHRFWRILIQAGQVFQKFSSSFVGKVSPVQFFWGSFDLAVTRFSGRKAPERPGADPITREAYSHEVISHGFWPGGGTIESAAFYAYAAPEPAGLKEARVLPAAATYNRDLSEFILPYDAVRSQTNPAEALTSFLQSTYEAAAALAHWDRASLERSS